MKTLALTIVIALIVLTSGCSETQDDGMKDRERWDNYYREQGIKCMKAGGDWIVIRKGWNGGARVCEFHNKAKTERIEKIDR